jgi:hypothetical protein
MLASSGIISARGFKNRIRERIFAFGQPKNDVVMARARHCDETGRAAPRRGCSHICFALTFKFSSARERCPFYPGKRHR